MLAVFIPVVAFMGVDRVTELRAQVSDRVYENLDTRLTLYQLAWKEFLEKPLTGTGWASFREASLAVSRPELRPSRTIWCFPCFSLAAYLSLPYLVVLSYLAYRALRHGGPYAAAVAAAIAISMTDPFFESAVGNLIVLPVAFLAGLPVATAVADDGGAIVVPRTDSARSRLRPTRRMRPESAS